MHLQIQDVNAELAKTPLARAVNIKIAPLAGDVL